MAGGLEIQIPYVDFSIKNKVPQRISITPTKVDVQKNLQYMSNKVKLTSSIQPLNTTENDIKWTIIDGSTYVSINSSTGELTIKDNAITQMVKVRAQSSSNASIYEDREIVVTYKEPIGIPEIQYDILVYDFNEQYVYLGPNTQYTVYAQLNPIINGKKVFVDINKGAEYVNIISGNFDDNKTTMVFSFVEPNDEYVDIEFTFYYEDNPDIKKVVPIRLVTNVNNILFRNIDGGPYQTDTLYKFEFYTEPEITTRRLNIDLIQGNEYISQWYDTSVNGTTGWLNFVRKNVEIENDQDIVFKFSDPLSDISTNISFTFSDVPIHRINIYNNKESYTYNSNNDFYYNFSWQEQPNTFERALSVNVQQTPNDIITWYKGDVSFGTGKFYFRPNSLTVAGDVSVRIYDPENILFAQDVLFKVQNPITMYTMLTQNKYDDNVILTNTNSQVKDVYNDTNYMYTLITFVSKENNVEFDIMTNNINNQSTGTAGKYAEVPATPEVEYFYNADRQNIYGGNGKVNRYINIDYNNITDKPYDVYTTWKTVNRFFTKRNLVLNNLSYVGERSNKTQENYENLYRIQVQFTETISGVTETETHYTYMDPDDSYVTDYFDTNNTKQLILNYRHNYDNQRITYTGSAVDFLTPLYQNDQIQQGISNFAQYGKSPKTCYAIKKTPYAPNHNVGEFTPCVNPGEVYNFKYTIEWEDNHEIYQVINIKFNIK